MPSSSSKLNVHFYEKADSVFYLRESLDADLECCNCCGLLFKKLQEIKNTEARGKGLDHNGTKRLKLARCGYTHKLKTARLGLIGPSEVKPCTNGARCQGCWEFCADVPCAEPDPERTYVSCNYIHRFAVGLDERNQLDIKGRKILQKTLGIWGESDDDVVLECSCCYRKANEYSDQGMDSKYGAKGAICSFNGHGNTSRLSIERREKLRKTKSKYAEQSALESTACTLFRCTHCILLCVNRVCLTQQDSTAVEQMGHAEMKRDLLHVSCVFSKIREDYWKDVCEKEGSRNPSYSYHSAEVLAWEERIRQRRNAWTCKDRLDDWPSHKAVTRGYFAGVAAVQQRQKDAASRLFY
ncbi:hypothetical protein BJ508DRAFT_363812 [Ascobolus immersus RN42]|uniref:Uncharacterized protein n=1 Tax=Ascobolus immersus RN42 TaxID=1160509 RepID=A0A3N4I2U3_ASCIM|nr:hypothetical protein BJ508DRAFT_363812 [Ascobolus immersus RN42]